jgi:hypothetical protein
VKPVLLYSMNRFSNTTACEPVALMAEVLPVPVYISDVFVAPDAETVPIIFTLTAPPRLIWVMKLYCPGGTRTIPCPLVSAAMAELMAGPLSEDEVEAP